MSRNSQILIWSQTKEINPFVFYCFDNSLGQADVMLRHAKGKIVENRVYALCVAKRAHRYAWHKGEKGDDFPDIRPSECFNRS